MAKSKGKGAKSFRFFNSNASKRELLFKEVSQEYAYVKKALGNGRFKVRIMDEDKDKRKVLLATIRGLMRKRTYVHKDDLVLISLRDFEDDKADIIHLYTPAEAYKLIDYGELSKNAFQLDGGDFPGEDEDTFEFANDTDDDMNELAEADIEKI
ncbi:hypothetical protein F4818DRAFT_439568 [Hypoxylon cercidicola]|nr:hypothetical protein F4818DRAFT_439568 [Hypoxylon cercidicola]